jgi:long-chain fatty acid transport protein
MKKQKIAMSVLVLGGLVSPLAHATNGMNLEGYGPVAEAMGGASMAYDNGVAAVMNNPATLGLMKEGSTEVGGGVGLLSPNISASAGGASANSSATAFYMPAIGYAHKSGQWTYGAAVFSQGGMGTEYAANSFMAAGTGDTVRSEVGVGRFMLPLAYSDDKFTIGGSLDFVWATMDLKMGLSGAQFGDMVSSLGGTQTYGSASGSMVNQLAGALTTPSSPCGNVPCLSGVNWARVDFSDSSQFTGQAKGNGYGYKLGGTYKVNDQLTLGATFHSKTSISDMNAAGATMSMNVTGPATSNVATLVPVTGSVSVHNFQWPQTYAVGGAYQANDKLLVVADYKRIGWKDVMQGFNMTFTADAIQSGLAHTFGMDGKSIDMTLYQNWDDQNVFEIGGAYKTTEELTLRAGVNLANNPVPDKFMNPLFPAIAKNHVTAGLGYAVSKASTVDFSYVYVPKVSATNGQGVTVDFAGYSSQLVYVYKY